MSKGLVKAIARTPALSPPQTPPSKIHERLSERKQNVFVFVCACTNGCDVFSIGSAYMERKRKKGLRKHKHKHTKFSHLICSEAYQNELQYSVP